MAEIAAYVKTHPKVERLFLSGNNLGLAGAKHLCALLLHPSLRLVRLGNKHERKIDKGSERERDVWAEEKDGDGVGSSVCGQLSKRAPIYALAPSMR